MYQSLIPNCRVTLSVIKQHYTINDATEQYIITGPTARARVQRLLNFLLTCLNADKDHIKFCTLINSITVLSELPHKMNEGNDINSVKW